MAVQQAIDRLNADIATPAANKGGHGTGDIVGRWREPTYGYVVACLPNGTATTTDQNGYAGKWVANGAAVEATFDNGVTHNVERTADGWAGFSKYGEKYTAVRYTPIP